MTEFKAGDVVRVKDNAWTNKGEIGAVVWDDRDIVRVSFEAGEQSCIARSDGSWTCCFFHHTDLEQFVEDDVIREGDYVINEKDIDEDIPLGFVAKILGSEEAFGINYLEFADEVGDLRYRHATGYRKVTLASLYADEEAYHAMRDEADAMNAVFSFPVGTKVRVTGKRGFHHCFDTGAVGTVVMTGEWMDDYVLEIDGLHQWVSKYDIEAYVENSPVLTGEFPCFSSPTSVEVSFSFSQLSDSANFSGSLPTLEEAYAIFPLCEPPQPTAGSILREAADIVDGQRNKTHGVRERSFQAIADFWNTYVKHKSEASGGIFEPVTLSAIDVAEMMVLLKVARQLTGETFADHFVDQAGYAGVAGELAAKAS